MKPDLGNLENFLQWAAALGVSDSPISVAASSSCLGHALCISHFPDAGGRGLAATRSINKGELVLRVPKEALMTSDCLIGNDQKLMAVLGNFPLLSSPQILSIALLNEINKGPSSAWYPYLKQLPQSYDLLASFTQFEIDALQIADAIWAAEKAVQKSKSEWEEATPILRALNLKIKLISFSAWLWASATISSRTMHIPWDAAGCLCPVGDFFNYAPPGEAPHSHTDDTNTDRLTDAGYDEALGCYCFYAKRNYEKGDQVLLSYGMYTNLELLEHYGFLLQDNPNDQAFISLEPEMYSLCSWPKDSLYISRDGKPSFALLSTIRLWATPLSKRKSVKHIALSGHIISAENESATMEWMMQKCETLLSSCSTSIDEDVKLVDIVEKLEDYNSTDAEYRDLSICDEIRGFLESHSFRLPLSVKSKSFIYKWKMAIEWRLSRKRILRDCISYCRAMLNNDS
ncbi:protein SET DOMAIN GROUP 40 [Andrographis paniculata]|uniref:protein SET DOMAIN GROUP 40 n=1 Tax=Andrographis paniculata TaxID=175694 RepID=UPI0021E8E308|nr:protein SET DOMAIN GROUP 40 [Andrographis paniculata]